jgi:hypothetical protein
VIREALTANNLKESDIDLFVPHQANARIHAGIQKEFNMPDEKVILKYPQIWQHYRGIHTHSADRSMGSWQSKRRRVLSA